MLARIRKATENKEQGFTLIELLVVMIIIGILAAIAVPTFLNQRKNGYRAAIKTDVRNAVTAIESWAVENGGSYASLPAGADLNVGANTNAVVQAIGIRPSSNVTLKVGGASTISATSYCIQGQDLARLTNGNADTFHYTRGTDTEPTTGACPAT